ncbi:daf-6 [Cordylochernes scorpioides]|uniref:Daf-6 n=1 Tax=Cordylochernes scorpioides TaxID=51811 RepID=A0ABY6LMS3_9ARAC|nr:daf-6 [Cordylochernes scorpioides]
METKRCSSCVPGLRALTGYYQPGQLSPGIGLDDTFVLLSAWRRTSRDKSVEERLCETYRHAGVSITITSLTNLTSFLVGSVTPFRAANILCAYMAVAIIFTYIYQITFFGGWMYYCGLAEEKNLHSLFFIRSQPKSLSTAPNMEYKRYSSCIPGSGALTGYYQPGQLNPEHRGLMYQLLLTGGRDSKNPYNEEDNKDHQGMVFFRDQVGEFLSKPRAKICIILVFFVYLTIAIYGCFQFQEGLEMYQIFGQNSYAHEFAKKEQEYFYEYLYRGQVMIYETLDYSDPAVQDRLENFMLALEANPRLGEGPVNESWLRYFKMFLNDKRTAFFTRQYNLTKKEDFIACLRNVFFKYPPAKRFMKDVVFNDNYTDIIATRYVFQAIDLHNTIDAKNLLASMWETIDESGYKAVVYHPMFLLVNTYIMVMPFTLQAIGITAVIMMIITFFFIPNITVAVWVAFSILSIECGVIGYMTLWGVNLNPTSLICLIICIGFSVDNSAHIAYAYVSSKDKNSNEKMKSALYFVGIPIIQACSSTLIGVLVIPFTPSYNFHVFFKTITLVMIFAGSHSLLLLPVLLSIFDKMFNKEQPTFGNNTHGAQDKLLTRYLPVEKKNTNSLIPNNNNS